MDFGPAIKSGFKNCFKFEGRSSRSEFWWFYLFNILMIIGTFVIGGVIIGLTSSNRSEDSSNIIASILVSLIFLYLLVMIFPTLSLMIRRLHDSGKSGWFLLLYIVPFGGIVLLVFYCLPGTVGRNQYGQNPLQHSDDGVSKVFD